MLTKTVIIGLVAFLCAPFAAAKEAPLRGLANPTLAFNLAMIRDWESAKPFINHARFMRPFEFAAKDGGNIRRADLPTGVFDSHGWVKRIPDNAKHASTIWHWNAKSPGAERNQGDYILTYDGEGDLALKLDVMILRRQPGRIEFRNRSGGPILLLIRKTDPEGNGNYIRNIKLLRKEHEALHKAGALFNPDWLASVSDARQVRFLNWMQTNGSHQKQWADRPEVDDATWAKGRGAPVEVLVRLANEIGADPWFTMPHQADADYNRKFATYVRDNLDPRLRAHVEYSNELWNRGFKQTKDLIAEAKRAGRGASQDEVVARRSYEVMEIWRKVFGSEAEGRLVRVLGSWAASPDWSKKLLSHSLERGAGWSRPSIAEGFDALAVATYFGGGKTMAPSIYDIWQAEGDAHRKMKAVLENRKLAGSPVMLSKSLQRQSELADRHGLKLLSYEGGQHLHTGKVHRIGGSKFQAAVVNLVYSEEMAEIYRDAWRIWREVGDGPFMQFVAVARTGRSGSWGLQRYPGEMSPAWRILSRLNAETPVWWGEAGGPHYQHGILDGDGGYIGTAEEDYLIGSGADEVFYPSWGSDGVFGGGGVDMVVLPDVRQAYDLDQQSGRTVLRRGVEVKTLTAIEKLRFADGETLTIRD